MPPVKNGFKKNNMSLQIIFMDILLSTLIQSTAVPINIMHVEPICVVGLEYLQGHRNTEKCLVNFSQLGVYFPEINNTS